MRNAWGQFGGQQKLGLSVLTSAVLYAALVGCDPLTVMEESDPSKLAVMYSGCHTVQEGPLCELPKLDPESATLPLTLHIELRDIPAITIRTGEGQTSWTSAQCSDETCVKTESGHRIVLSIPESTREVIVKSAKPEISNWTLPIINFRERPAVMSDAVALEQSSKRNEALQLLETALPTLAPHWQAEAMSHIARMYKRLGKADEALRSFAQSMDLHLETGGLSHYVKDGTAAVHTLIMDAGMKLNEARDLAASLRGILPQHYESQHFYHWASLFAADMALDHRNGLHHGETGIRLAKDLGNHRFGGFFVQFLANTYQKLGRFDDALELLEARWVQSALVDGSCDQAESQNALGFINWKFGQIFQEKSFKHNQRALKHLTLA
ncbi:MAG: tetratricopeptide repeat protein, partial [Myxococcota bacterium]|nr:tetratricopeptide repeat protein [Myxococcota bacterium]